MRNFYSLVLMLLFAVTVQAQTTTIWLGGSTDWDDPANWSEGVPESGFTVTIPGTPPNGSNFPVFSGGPLVDFTIQSFGGSITFNSVVYNTGSIVNSGGGSVINNSIFINAGMVTFNNNDGTFLNNGIVDNYGTFNNAGTSTIENPTGSVFNNYGNIDNFGTINNDGNLLNNGDLVSTSTIQNNGTITNNGFLNVAFGGTFNNAVGATILNSSGAFVEVNTAFTNAGTITSDGSWFIQVGSTLFDNSGNFTNNGRLDISGLLNNTGTLVNSNEVFINDSGILDNYDVFTNNGTVTLSVCGQLIQNANNDIVGTILNNGIIYILDGSVTVTSNLEFGSEFTDLSQRKVPDTKCRSGMFVFLDENGMGTIDINAVDKNSYGFCGATIVTRELSQDSFTVADLGVNELTLTTTDNFGFSSSCTSFITVVDYFPPVVDVDDPDIDFNCPADITVTPPPGGSSEIASWVEPIATTNCTSGGGGNLPSCVLISNDIPGYTFLGEFNNSKYYVSTSSTSWSTARDNAVANNGILASINDAAENDFLKDNTTGSNWIGLTDENVEGTFEWLSGEPLTYTNWNAGEPNDFGTGEDRVEFLNSGRWNDNSNNTNRNSIMEIACSAELPSCVDISETIAGFSFMGEYNDSKYFLSNATANWSTANAEAIANGGHLVTIGDANENEFIKSNLTSGTSAWLGITDAATEGTWELVTGGVATYLNWSVGEPNEGTGANHARIRQSDGNWTDRNQSLLFYYIIEKECQQGPPACINVNENIAGATFLGEFNSSKFYVSNAATNWVGAKSISESNGGHLAVIDSQEENDFIQNEINPASGSVWIGLNNVNNGSIFQWVTLDPVGYTNWQNGEPNGAPGGHATRLRENTGEWTDRPISDQYEFVFEIPCGGNNNDPNGGLTVSQITGGLSGQAFPIGENSVSYSVTDNCGNEEIRTFTVTVLENPADITVTDCPVDIVVDAAPGAPSAPATWTDPTATTDCFKPNTTIEQTIGEVSGSDFLIGTHSIAYSITDSCGNFVACSFNVIINEVVATLTLDQCPVDQNIQVAIGDTSGVAIWDDPTGTTDCYQGAVQANQLVGLTSGSDFPLGVNQVVYVLTDECGNSSLCAFNIAVSETCPAAGTACDDGDPSTENDVEDGNCNCAGTPCPTAGTTCDDGDATTENDIEDGNCNCAGTPILCPDAGTACDDGDATTESDVEDGNCNCAGTPCPDAGTTCDDGDANTENDIADGTCGCAGTPIVVGCASTENLSLKPIAFATQSSTQLGAEASRAIDGNTNGDFFGGNSVSLTNWESNAWWELDLGLVSNIETINIYNREDCCQQFLSNYYIIISDAPFTSTDLNETLNQPGVSSYLQTDQVGLPSAISIDEVGRYVRIQIVGTSFLGLTEVEVIGCIAGSGCAPAGTICDDGDDTTENDIEDGDCGCAGTPCPTAGITCDDGNASTENDVADGSCGCAGTPIGGGCSVTENLALNGTATESSVQLNADGGRAIDGNTNGDFYGGNSVSLTNWTTQPWVEVDLGEVGNIETVNVWNRTDCCEGFLKNYYILVSDVPFTSTVLANTLAQSGVDGYLETSTAGSPTSILINRTGRYVRIQLQGTSFLGLAELEIIGCIDGGGCPAAGTPCDDGDASTENDIEDGDCGCAGTPCPIAGTTCDDGDANTIDDMEDGNCNCFGTPINCPDAGTACDDGDSSTENDVEDGDCGCAGIPCPTLGTACDDGDASTENDMEDGNCNCAGTPIGCATTSNLALVGTPNQSSTLTAGGITGSAGKAIDGNTNGVFFTSDPSASSVTATNNETEPYWEVELDASYLIEQIDVYNRTDGVDKTNNIYVLVSNVPFTSTDLAGARAEAAWEEFIPGLVGTPSTVLPNVNGKYVRIQMDGSGYLVLAEVEVIGCTDPTPSNYAVPNMLYFNAKKNGIHTNIDWLMAKDVEVDFYEVEVSTDGNLFRLLDETNAAQVNSPQQYEMVDLKPAFGENFYRLKVNQLDGTYFYSNIRRVNFEIDFDEVVVFPNPTKDNIYIDIRDFAGKSGIVEIYNNLGQKMMERNYQSFPSIPAEFDVSGFTNGFYTISIKVENHKRFTKKFIVSKL